MCDLLDEIERVNNEPNYSSARIAEEDRIVSPWKDCKPLETGANLSTLLKVADDCTLHKGYAKQVIDNLYLYNSTVDIIKSYNGEVLLVLPQAEVVIDLFNPSKGRFIGPVKYSSVDHYISEILKAIKCDGYKFLSLDEALDFSSILLKLNDSPKITKGEILCNGCGFRDSSLWRKVLNIIFHGNHNWACNMFYYPLEHNLLRFNVFCYECLPYIKEDGNYCIETSTTIETHKDFEMMDESQEIALLSCFNPNDPNSKRWSGNTALKFLGIFKIDKERSKIENHLAFKLLQKELYV